MFQKFSLFLVQLILCCVASPAPNATGAESNLSELVNRFSNINQEAPMPLLALKKTAPACQAITSKYSLSLGDDCQTLDYPLIECDGYCQSKSMIWVNDDEVQDVECCTIKNVQFRFSKMYCSKKLTLNQIKSRLQTRIKDKEMLEFFQILFGIATWSSHGPAWNRTSFKGYFNVKTFFNASCQCQGD